MSSSVIIPRHHLAPSSSYIFVNIHSHPARKSQLRLLRTQKMGSQRESNPCRPQSIPFGTEMLRTRSGHRATGPCDPANCSCLLGFPTNIYVSLGGKIRPADDLTSLSRRRLPMLLSEVLGGLCGLLLFSTLSDQHKRPQVARTRWSRNRLL